MATRREDEDMRRMEGKGASLADGICGIHLWHVSHGHSLLDIIFPIKPLLTTTTIISSTAHCVGNCVIELIESIMRPTTFAYIRWYVSGPTFQSYLSVWVPPAEFFLFILPFHLLNRRWSRGQLQLLRRRM